MACVSTPSMRYLMATESSRVSMWISLARRSSAVKIVVSTSRMMGLSPSAVSRSIEMRLVAALFVADDVQRKAFAGLFEHALRLLGLLEDVGDLRERGNFGR